MMNKIISSFVLISSLLFAVSCAEEDPVPEGSESFYLEYGTECGWCAGHRYLEISEGKVHYSFIIPCGENEGTINDSRNLTAEEWQNIQNAFDYEYLLSLNFNECRVCVDGCDEIIRINGEENLHEIRYMPGEEIEGIEELQEILADMMEEFMEND